MLDCAVEHMGAERANRYLRKFYPWYIERLGGTRAEQAALQAALQQAESIEHARELFAAMACAALMLVSASASAELSARNSRCSTAT